MTRKNSAYSSWFIASLTAFVLLFGGCNREDKFTGSDTPTAGTIKISADESFAPIIDSQLQTFHHLYKYAKITAAYKPESQAINDLLIDSARLIAISRKLTPAEMQRFEKLKLIPTSTKIATDGIAIILNRENNDTLLSVDQLKTIFTGQTSSWKQINPKSPHENIVIVFDNGNSGTARFVQDSVINRQPLPKNTFASGSNAAVIDYVAKNKNAVGVIGMNWISDFDDSTVVGFIKSVHVAAISRKTDLQNPDSYYLPYQAYLVKKMYPLTRDVYLISREARAGLGTGFASFVAGDKGQRIMLKAGLAPARGVVRLVNVTE